MEFTPYFRKAAIFAFTDGDHWRPGIGDPTVIGWVTVVAYAMAFGFCYRRGLAERRLRPQKPEAARFWFVLTAFMGALGLNKQLDLQTWLTLSARHFAIDHGWYERRRVLQAVFILLVALSCAALAALTWSAARRFLHDQRVTFIGALYLGAFIVIRAASFHHIDQMLGIRFGGVKINGFLELSGIAWIVLGSVMGTAKEAPTPAPPVGGLLKTKL